MRKSAKKQQSQLTGSDESENSTSINVTQIKRKYKQILERQSLVLLLMSGELLLFLRTGIKKTAVWKTTFVSEHLDAVKSQWIKCFALVECFVCCSLGDSS